MSNATPDMQPRRCHPSRCGTRPVVSGRKPHLDLFGQQEQFWETWPTSGMTRNGSVFRLPSSAHPTPDTASSSSPTALFRTPLASDAARGGETLQQVKARRGTIALSHQIIYLALHGSHGYPQTEEPESLWSLIGQLFNDGDDTPKL
ncbi:hypothetical protein [Microbacterium shaanxiense]